MANPWDPVSTLQNSTKNTPNTDKKPSGAYANTSIGMQVTNEKIAGVLFELAKNDIGRFGFKHPNDLTNFLRTRDGKVFKTRLSQFIAQIIAKNEQKNLLIAEKDKLRLHALIALWLMKEAKEADAEALNRIIAGMIIERLEAGRSPPRPIQVLRQLTGVPVQDLNEILKEIRQSMEIQIQKEEILQKTLEDSDRKLDELGITETTTHKDLTDEQKTTIIAALDKECNEQSEVQNQLVDDIERHINNNEYDKAEELMSQLASHIALEEQHDTTRKVISGDLIPSRCTGEPADLTTEPLRSVLHQDTESLIFLTDKLHRELSKNNERIVRGDDGEYYAIPARKSFNSLSNYDKELARDKFKNHYAETLRNGSEFTASDRVETCLASGSYLKGIEEKTLTKKEKDALIKKTREMIKERSNTSQPKPQELQQNSSVLQPVSSSSTQPNQPKGGPVKS